MEVEPGKLFIGGISWDTNDGRLREYFETFGEVAEAVIMKDRNTGRARGFGFVVFADASVAEKVLKEKHVIDGRMVEAKKAVPRDDQNVVVRYSSSGGSIHGSPGPSVRTKKIFVGGLASNVTESEFKKYFDQFGTITDVVVMYDHNTQRPRGFGFITYDSEEAVDKVLVKIFHELNGKMVEVKRAVPKELSPGPNPNRSPLSGYNSYGISSRVSSLLNTYVQGQSGLRVDGRLSPITIGRNGYPSFSPTGYGMGLNFEPGLNNSPFGLNGNLSGGGNSPNFGYGRGPPNSYYGGSSNSRYSGNGSSSAAAAAAAAALSSPNRSLWLNGGQNVEELIGSGMGNAGLIGAGFGNFGTIWGGGGGGGGSSTMSGQSAVSNYNSGNSVVGSSGMDIGYRRNVGSNGFPSGDGVQGRFGNLYGDGSMYLDSTWRLPQSLDFDGSGSFGYGSENLGSISNVVASNNSVGYVGDYSVSNRSTRGIVT